MRVFELHFNSKKRSDSIFDSFIFEPENSSETDMGNLYIIGELTRTLPQNTDFLNKLSAVIKKEYYSAGKLEIALKKANEFLDKEARTGNVNWLGNLSCSILSLQNYDLNFSSSGKIKILLCRNGELLDIGQNLELSNTKPLPLKIFSNIAAGKLAPDDKIILLTKDIFSFLSQKGEFFNQLKNISNEKELKKLLKMNKKLLSEATGICLLLLADDRFQKEPSRPQIQIHRKLTRLFAHKSSRLLISLLLILVVGFFIFDSSPEEPKEKEEVETINEIELRKSAEAKIIEAEKLLILGKQNEARKLLLEAYDIIAEFEEKETASLQTQIRELLKHLPE